MLKGQNFRVLLYDATAEKMKVVAMATNCTINLNNNVEQASTKDDVGMFDMPSVMSHGWSVQVESLNVLDIARFLNGIKASSQFDLMWDVVDDSDNQTITGDYTGREGHAYLTDCTFSFNNRENSAKNLTFVGCSELNGVSISIPHEAIAVPGTLTKGQFIRLFLAPDATTTPANVIAYAQQLQLHIAVQMESVTTKDTTGTFDLQAPSGISYDITSTALVVGNDTITSQVGGYGLLEQETNAINGTLVKWQIANVSGANNRTKGSVLVSGKALVQSLQINAQNRQAVTYTANMQGYGEYTVGA